MTVDQQVALVIGAGPAGLMAADQLLAAGHRVVLTEAKPSAARKLLMAGKSGLNLTKDEPLETFINAYDDAADWIRPYLTDFGPAKVIDWARGLGQSVFTGSSGRVFPTVLKGSPLLRAWLADLSARGLDLRTRWRWTGLADGEFTFETPDGPHRLHPGVTVLALGGASWPRLGSDGSWADILRPHGVVLAPFQPANMGFAVTWSRHMTPHFGAPLKNIALMVGQQRIRAEAVLSARGLEGGGIYAVSRALREGAGLHIDLFPDRSEEALAQALAKRPAKESLTNSLRKALGLSGVRLALFLESAHPVPLDPPTRAKLLKTLPINIEKPFPIAEAISTAGGIQRAAVDDDLMLKSLPGVFAAGEMLDWEAPTGGYLLTACFATGRHAGDAAARYLHRDPGQDEPTAD